MEEQGNLEAWATGEEIDISTLDNLVRHMKNLETEYEDAKKISTEKLRAYEEVEGQVLSLLQKAGKSKWNVDGLGTAYVINRFVVQTPKTNEDKEKLFDYINSKYGRDVLTSKLSVNSATLNSFCKEEREQAERDGQLLIIPGISDPVHQTSLGFRKG